MNTNENRRFTVTLPESTYVDLKLAAARSRMPAHRIVAAAVAAELQRLARQQSRDARAREQPE